MGDPAAPARFRRTWRRWIGAAGWGMLLALCAGTVWFTFRPTPTTFHLSAVTEEAWIDIPRAAADDTSGQATSAISFGRVWLASGNARIPLHDTRVRLSDGARIRLQRMLPDTLVVAVDAFPGAGIAGSVHRDTGRIRVLGAHARFLVPLAGPEANASFLLPFRARHLKVGSVPGNSSGQRTPLLRSGEIRLVARTRPGLDFESNSYALRSGQQVDLPASGSRAGVGRGLVLVEAGEPGMAVNYTLRAGRAAVSRDNHEELLATGVFDRARHDPVIALGWVLVVTLVLSPLGSAIADRIKRRAETFLERS